MNRFAILFTAFVCLLTGPRSVPAQMTPSVALAAATSDYRKGVQHYYEDDAERAIAYFDRALSFAPDNPRFYYFRGLAKHKAGRSFEGDNDLRNGAVIEAGKGPRYPLGLAIKSLPIEDRRRVREIRVEVLGPVATEVEDQALAVLRSRFRLPLSAMMAASSPAGVADGLEPSDEAREALARIVSDPFADDPAPASLLAPPAGTTEEIPPAPPAGEPAAPAGDAENPIGGGNPFGDDSPAVEENPFGVAEDVDAPGTPPAGGNPFGAPAPGEGDNPFGDADENPFDGF